MDYNRVALTGLVVSQPYLSHIGSNTPYCIFTLKVLEFYTDKVENEKCNPNFIEIEALGKNAISASQKVKAGHRYAVDGYLRRSVKDGEESKNLKVRLYTVYKESGDQARYFKEGLAEALNTVLKTSSLEEAISKLKANIEN